MRFSIFFVLLFIILVDSEEIENAYGVHNAQNIFNSNRNVMLKRYTLFMKNLIKQQKSDEFEYK